MNLEDSKYRLTNGDLSEREEQELATAVSADESLADELRAQFAMDAVLTISLSDGAADDAIIKSVQKELRDRPVAKEPLRVSWWMAAAASVAIAFSLGTKFGSQVLRSSVGESVKHDVAIEPMPSLEEASPLPETFQFLEGLETNEAFAAAFAEIEASKGLVNRPQRDRMKQLLLYRWTEQNASAALEFALEQEGDDSVRHVFKAWARLAPERALAEANSLERRGLAHRAIFSELAAHDPASFKALVEQADELDPETWGDLFRQLPMSEADALFADLAPDRRETALPEFATALVQKDHQAAITWASKLSDNEERTKAVAAVLGEIAWTDSNAAGTALLALDGDHGKISVEIAKRMATGDPHAALEWVGTYTDGDVRAKAYQRVFREVSRSGNSDLFEMIDGLVEREGYETVFADSKEANMAGVFWWGRELDYRRGLEWALELPEDVAYRTGVISGLTNSWMKSLKSEPGAHQEVADYIYAVTDDPKILEELNGGIVHQLGQRPYAFDDAWDYASSLPEEHGRERHMMDIFKRYVKYNRDRALELYDNLPSDQAAPVVASEWAEGAPLDAVAWATALPEGAGKTAAFGEIAKSWSQYDSLAASEWVATLSEGVVRDAAIEQMVNQVAEWDGHAAFQWAATISDRDRRTMSLESAVRALNAQDTVAAQTAIESAENLTETERVQLLQTLGKETKTQ